MSAGSSHFFAYNPRTLRLGLLCGVVVCVAMSAWALSNALASGAVQEWARLGVAAGLLGAFGYVLFRVRPRPGWGVKVDPLGMKVSRPLPGEPMELVWSQIMEVRRQRGHGEKLVVLLRPEGRVLLPRHLFPSKAVFEALAEVLQERAPRPAGDA